jgi:hypothetical protein
MLSAFFREAFVYQTSLNDTDIAFGDEISFLWNYIPDDNEHKNFILPMERNSFNVL